MDPPAMQGEFYYDIIILILHINRGNSNFMLFHKTENTDYFTKN